MQQREFDFTDNDFHAIIDIVKEKTGIKLAEHKRNMVYSRLARRLRELKYQSFEEYLDFIQSEEGDSETGNFVNAITTNLTSFFREKHHFDHLKTYIEKMAVAKNSSKRLRIWSCASSSGQEPYSIAMTVQAAIPDLSRWDAKILATDIDTNMVNTCIAGEYRSEQLEDIPAEYRKKFSMVASRNQGLVMMPETLKKMLTFKPLNLLHDWPMKGPFDVVFCRNVVIYFDKPTQVQLFDRIADLLKPEGILYIGHSESLFNVSDRFELIGRTTYQKVK